ncbi:MAG: hydroxysqualene dehydroxylase HpnE [Gallionellaceae bacterium]
MAQELNVGIIGGGYAGMAAAVTLAERSIPLTVYESAKQLGGRARGIPFNDMQLDNGQHLLLGCYHETLRLIELVGGDIERDFLRLPLQLTLHNCFELKSARLPAPLHLLFGLLTAHGLTFAQRMNAVRFMLAMRRTNFSLSGEGERGNGMTVTELLQAYAQDEKLQRLLWRPICIAALNTPAHKASAQVLLNVLRDSLNSVRSHSDLLLPRMDFSALFPERAAHYVQQRGGAIFTSCGVQAIIPHGAGIELLTANACPEPGRRSARRYSHVICAASPANTARMLRDVPQCDSVANLIESIPFQPIFTVYLQYPEQVVLPQPMLAFDRCITQWLFDKGQIAGQHGLIAAVISAEGLHQEWDHQQLAQNVAQELHEQLGLVEPPLWSKVIAEKRATFSCEPGLVRPAHTTPLGNLLLAGDYTAGDYPATLEAAVMSGIRCAKEVLSA